MLNVVVDCRHMTMEFYVLILNTVIIAITAEPSCEQRPGVNVGEYGDYFEGDMILTEAQQKAVEDAKMPSDVNDDNDENPSKNGVVDASLRWPNKTVTYHIDEGDFKVKIEEKLNKRKNIILDQDYFKELYFCREADIYFVWFSQQEYSVVSVPKLCLFLCYSTTFPCMDKKEKTMLEDAIKDLASKSCVQFRKRQNNQEYAVVLQKKTSGCYSYVGYLKPVFQKSQVLNLESGCFLHGIIVHEMLHTLGFYHMQSTYDRDDFVTIEYKNIQNGYENNFNKYNNSTVTDFGVPYDYGSVMHYEETAFSKNGQKTIIPKKEGVTIGQRKGLSKRDALKLNKMYNCQTQETTTEKDGIVDWDFLDDMPKP